LLHEIAHSITGNIDKPGDHGPAFAGTFMRLVSGHIATFELAELMRTAELEDVDFRAQHALGARQGRHGKRKISISGHWLGVTVGVLITLVR